MRVRLALVVLAALAAPVGAQPAAPSPEVLEQARVRFDEGKRLHQAGQFDAAAAQYLAAYEAYPLPAFLFNIAQVNRLGGHPQVALDYYRRYLAAAPDGDGAADAREFVAALERALADDRRARAAGDAPPVRVEPPGGSSKAANAAPLDLDLFHRVHRAGRGKKAIGAGLAIAGAGALALGLYFGTHAADLDGSLSGHTGPWTPADAARYREGERSERRMWIATSVGAALVAGGAVVFALGVRDAHRAEAELGPTAMIVDGGGGLAVAGRF